MSAPEFQTLSVNPIDQAILLVAFNRPNAANALNKQMGLELAELLSTLTENPQTYRVMILTGAGKHFCAGADLKERKGMDEAAWHAQHDAFEKSLRLLLRCPLPVIAAVNGAAMGGGLELALACDFIYASENARFALTEATLGIMPGMGGTQTLPRAIGPRQAKEFLFRGQIFSAAEAYGAGMINKITPAASLLDEALTAAKSIAANAPLSIRAIKQAVDQGAGLPLKEALEGELQHYRTLLNSKDRHEGINAFNEKRQAVFTGE